MTYTRVNWQNTPSTATPRNAENLNIMDLGIKEAHDLKDRFDESAMAAAGEPQVLAFYQSSQKWGPRTLLATDIPANVRKVISATTYTLIATDFGKLLHFTAATAITVSIPAGLVTPADAVVQWRQHAAGQLTFVGTGSPTPAAVGGYGGALKSAGQYAGGQIDRVGTTEEYIISGQTTT